MSNPSRTLIKTKLGKDIANIVFAYYVNPWDDIHYEYFERLRLGDNYRKNTKYYTYVHDTQRRCLRMVAHVYESRRSKDILTFFFLIRVPGCNISYAYPLEVLLSKWPPHTCLLD